MPEAGADRGTGQERGERKRFPLNPAYRHVCVATTFSFEALQSKDWMEQKRNVKAAQHPAAPTSRAKARSTAEQGNEPFGDTAPDALQSALQQEC